MIIVDTNVTSEVMKPAPAPAVIAWIRAQRASELFATSITLAEIRYGIERLADGRRKELLRRTAEEVFAAFAGEVLPFDAAAASHYAAVVTSRERARAPISGFDAQIASICRAHSAILATRNVTDFADTGIEVVNPWTDAR